MKVDLDFRDEMNEWIRDYGVTVLYQRSSNYIKCSCVDPLYKAPDSRCTKCNGTGKLIKTQKLKILMQEQYPPNRKGQYDYSQVGQIYAPQITFYFVHNEPPKVKDIVYIVGWDKGRPVNLINMYEITGFQGHRGEDGRIEFYMISATSKPELMSRGKEYLDRLRRMR